MYRNLIITYLICIVYTTGFIYREDSLRNNRETKHQYNKLDKILRNTEVTEDYKPSSTKELLSKNVLEIAKKLLTLSTQHNYSNIKYQVFSPIGIANVLSLLALGAKQMTEHELYCALGFNQIPEFYVNPLKVHEKFGQLIEQLKEDNISHLRLHKMKRSPLLESLSSHPTRPQSQKDSFLSTIPNQYRNLKNYHIFRRSTKTSAGGGTIKFPETSESRDSIQTKMNYDKLWQMSPANRQINLQNRQQDHYQHNEPNENESKELNDHEIDIANGIFIQNGYQLKTDYENNIKRIYRYNTDIRMLDFENDSETARQHINEWGKLKTHGKIKKIIEDNLDETTNMIITSALYYRSIWQQSFIENYTMKRSFYPNGKDEKYVLVDMMTNGGEFLYYDAVEYECHFIGLPFKDNLSIMYIIMPYDSNKGKLHKIQELLTSERIDNIISNRMQKRQILLNLPRMNLESSINLREILLQMGIKTLFNSKESDLSGIISRKYTTSTENNRFTSSNSNNESILLKKIQNLKSTMLPQQKVEKMESIIEIKKTNRNHRNNNPAILFEDDLKLINNRYNEYMAAGRSTTGSTNRQHLKQRPTVRINNSRYNWYENKKNHKRNIGRMSLLSSRTSYNNNAMDNNEDEINNHDYYDFKNNENYEVKHKEEVQNGHYKTLFVDNIVHKINLKINEKGVEGVATTVTHLSRNDFDDEFSIDGPFLFLIRHEKTKLPIFYGSIYDPSV